MKPRRRAKPLSPYALRYWPLWLAIGGLWLIIQLPYRWQVVLGKGLGLFAQAFARRERKIAAINLARCFPQLSQRQRQKLLRQSFMAAGISSLETVFAWWAPQRRLEKLLTIEGLEHINQILEQRRGALIIAPHFAGLHIVGRLLNQQQPFAVMYLPPKNPVFRHLSARALQKHYAAAIPRDGARQLINALKNAMPVLYTPDTDAGKKHPFFVPFFGVMAATLTATARFAEISGCAVIPATFYRRADLPGYHVRFYPALDNYPSGALYADMLRVNQFIEQAIREQPEEYLWQYKRFKTRPSGEAKFYPQ